MPVPLPSDYSAQQCSVARALEVLGERWTLLIVRDAFYGVRRFGDFVAHLDIPRAVLSARLRTLVDEDVLARVPAPTRPSGRDEYELTEKGRGLWPVVRELMAWGDAHYAPDGPVRLLRHTADGGLLDPRGRCLECGVAVPADEVRVERGPGYAPDRRRTDPVSTAIGEARNLLEPLRL